MARTTRAKYLTASGQVLSGEGWIEGFYVNSNASSGTMVIYHGTTATNTGAPFGGTITPAAGSHYLFGLHSTAGVYCSMTGVTFAITFLVKETD